MIVIVLLIVIVIIIMIVIMDRPQEVREGPLGHLQALPPPSCVREPEVDALVDADVDHILGRVREAPIRAHILHILDGRGVGTRDQEGELVSPEEEPEHTGDGSRHIVCARSVVRIVRGVDQRLPVRVAGRPPVAVVVSLPNGRDGPPVGVAVLAVPGGDCSIGHRHGNQGEEPGTVTNVVDMLIGDGPEGSVPLRNEVLGPEIGEVGLLGSAGAVEAGSYGLDLVIVPGVPAAV
jgi:hypothetical protein